MPRRPVALEDLFRFKLAGDTQISPDGRKVVFTVKRADAEKNKYYTSLWLGDVESRQSRQLTGDGHSDSEPRWSPDGKLIAFASNRDKPKSQIYVIPFDGGGARARTSLEEGSVQSLVWSPDGRRIAFFYGITPGDPCKGPKKER